MFEMKIVDVFHFSDGRTVFVGHISGKPKYIRPCKCDLLIDGVPKAQFQIEGEMISDSQSAQGFRSISTCAAVPLDKNATARSTCVLRSSGEPQ